MDANTKRIRELWVEHWKRFSDASTEEQKAAAKVNEKHIMDVIKPLLVAKQRKGQTELTAHSIKRINLFKKQAKEIVAKEKAKESAEPKPGEKRPLESNEGEEGLPSFEENVQVSKPKPEEGPAKKVQILNDEDISIDQLAQQIGEEMQQEMKKFIEEDIPRKVDEVMEQRQRDEMNREREKAARLRTAEEKHNEFMKRADEAVQAKIQEAVAEIAEANRREYEGMNQLARGTPTTGIAPADQVVGRLPDSDAQRALAEMIGIEATPQDVDTRRIEERQESLDVVGDLLGGIAESVPEHAERRQEERAQLAANALAREQGDDVVEEEPVNVDDFSSVVATDGGEESGDPTQQIASGAGTNGTEESVQAGENPTNQTVAPGASGPPGQGATPAETPGGNPVDQSNLEGGPGVTPEDEQAENSNAVGEAMDDVAPVADSTQINQLLQETGQPIVKQEGQPPDPAQIEAQQKQAEDEAIAAQRGQAVAGTRPEAIATISYRMEDVDYFDSLLDEYDEEAAEASREYEGQFSNPNGDTFDDEEREGRRQAKVDRQKEMHNDKPTPMEPPSDQPNDQEMQPAEDVNQDEHMRDAPPSIPEDQLPPAEGSMNPESMQRLQISKESNKDRKKRIKGEEQNTRMNEEMDRQKAVRGNLLNYFNSQSSNESFSFKGQAGGHEYAMAELVITTADGTMTLREMAKGRRAFWEKQHERVTKEYDKLSTKGKKAFEKQLQKDSVEQIEKEVAQNLALRKARDAIEMDKYVKTHADRMRAQFTGENANKKFLYPSLVDRNTRNVIEYAKDADGNVLRDPVTGGPVISTMWSVQRDDAERLRQQRAVADGMLYKDPYFPTFGKACKKFFSKAEYCQLARMMGQGGKPYPETIMRAEKSIDAKLKKLYSKLKPTMNLPDIPADANRKKVLLELQTLEQAFAQYSTSALYDYPNTLEEADQDNAEKENFESAVKTLERITMGQLLQKLAGQKAQEIQDRNQISDRVAAEARSEKERRFPNITKGPGNSYRGVGRGGEPMEGVAKTGEGMDYEITNPITEEGVQSMDIDTLFNGTTPADIDGNEQKRMDARVLAWGPIQSVDPNINSGSSAIPSTGGVGTLEPPGADMQRIGEPNEASHHRTNLWGKRPKGNVGDESNLETKEQDIPLNPTRNHMGRYGGKGQFASI